MKILCLTDLAHRRPDDRWLWNHFESDDEVDFVDVALRDDSARWGKLVTRYPALLKGAVRAQALAERKSHDLILAWEGKAGAPLGLIRMLTGRRWPPVMVLTFTPGDVPAVFRPFIRLGLRGVDRLAVITKAEIDIYSKLYGVPKSKLSLCPLGTYDIRANVLRRPALAGLPPGAFIHASGRSARDYDTLVKAVADLDIKVLIHGRGYNFAGIQPSSNVEIGEMVPRNLYDQLVLNALFEVVPLQDLPMPIGGSQILFAMMMGKAIIATRTPSTIDYIEDGVTGLLTPPGDVAAMRTAIRWLLEHPAEAQRMGATARQRYEERHTFDAFAQRAHDLMVQVVQTTTPSAPDF